MRRYLALILSGICIMGLLMGCSATSSLNTAASDGKQGKVAFISGISGVEDKGFNEFSYKGVQEFAETHLVPYGLFTPAGTEDQDFLDAISEAIEKGYTLIVLPGAPFAKTCRTAAMQNPEVLFLGLGFTPMDMGAPQAPANVALLIHKEEQAGFLAGYAAVADGYRNLGFIGGMPVPAVVRFGHGYVQGAEKAAHALNLSNVHVKYWYSGSFVPTEETRQRAASWYQDGTEVIFSCGGSLYASVLEAADACDGMLIGVDVDQSELSPRFLTSAVKDLTNTVDMALTAAFKNNMTWPGSYSGACRSLGVMEDCVGLAMDNARFRNFSPEMYQVLYAALVNVSVTVDNHADPDRHPPVQNITVDWQS